MMPTDLPAGMTPSPIGFDLGTRSFTYHVENGRVVEERGLDGAAAVVALSGDDWDHVLGQTRTFINLFLAGDLRFVEGDFEAIVEWEPLLKQYHWNIPVYDPDRVDLSDMDLSRTFSVEDSDDEIRSFLVRAGFAHLKHVFSSDAMEALNAEVDRLADLAAPDDQTSWWVDDASGTPTLCRLVYGGRRSEIIAAFESDETVLRLGTLLRPDAALRLEGPLSGRSSRLGGHRTGRRNPAHRRRHACFAGTDRRSVAAHHVRHLRPADPLGACRAR